MTKMYQIKPGVNHGLRSINKIRKMVFVFARQLARHNCLDYYGDPFSWSDLLTIAWFEMRNYGIDTYRLIEYIDARGNRQNQIINFSENPNDHWTPTGTGTPMKPGYHLYVDGARFYTDQKNVLISIHVDRIKNFI